MTNNRTSIILAALITVSLWPACGHEQEAKSPEAPPSQASTAAPAAPAGDAGNGPMASSAPAGAATAPEPAATSAAADAGGPPSASASGTETAPNLTDEQIVQVLHTANRGEIEQGTLAQGKAHDTRVKKLAAMMVKDHTAADTKGSALAKKDKLTLSPSSLSSSIQSDAESTTSSLKSESGKDFDRAYVDAQVKEHQAVLDTIDHTLLPAVKNPDLKAFIDDVRPKIEMHLHHAQDLQQALQK